MSFTKILSTRRPIPCRDADSTSSRLSGLASVA